MFNRPLSASGVGGWVTRLATFYFDGNRSPGATIQCPPTCQPTKRSTHLRIDTPTHQPTYGGGDTIELRDGTAKETSSHTPRHARARGPTLSLRCPPTRLRRACLGSPSAPLLPPTRHPLHPGIFIDAPRNGVASGAGPTVTLLGLGFGAADATPTASLGGPCLTVVFCHTLLRRNESYLPGLHCRPGSNSREITKTSGSITPIPRDPTQVAWVAASAAECRGTAEAKGVAYAAVTVAGAVGTGRQQFAFDGAGV